MISVFRSDQVSFIAASLAYYAFVSLLPLLLLALVAAATFGGPDQVAAITDRVTASLGPAAGSLVRDALVSAGGAGAGAGVVGLIVLLWTGLKVFRGLDVAFAIVYGSTGPAGLVDQVTDALVALVTVAVGISATVVIGALISLPGVDAVVAGVDLFGLVATLTLLGGLTIGFLPLYYVLPERGMTVREALPGAVLAAAGWGVLMTGFRLYAARAGSYEAYGVLGGVLLLVTFLYLGALVLLAGVVLNAVLSGPIDGEPDLDPAGPGRADEVELSLAGVSQLDVSADDLEDHEEADLAETVDRLHERLSEFEERVDERTVHREEVERDLRAYVRRRVRAGKARGWGPYLVLLYGTAMTIGAFVYLSGGWAILAMIVIWLSTLGLYVLMLIVGATVTVAGLPGRLKERVDSLR
jgi:YihY family inner membrane protein